MAVERKRKGKAPESENVQIYEDEQATSSKRPKLQQSHSAPVKNEPLDTMELGCVGEGKGRKRKRKKRYYHDLRQQMEFYFGDSNLSKSKFMMEEMSKNEEGWIDLEIFLRFNKLAEMMKTFFGRLEVDDLWTALSLKSDGEVGQKDISKMGTLVETRMHPSTGVRQVRRNKPLQKKSPELVEKCTVYIENLPSFVTNDSLKRVFSDCLGPVDYVSLPRYKHNRAVKGFAFVEFADVKGAEAAIKRYEEGENDSALKSENKSVDGQRIQPLEKDPAELQSIKSFQTEQAIEKGIEIPKYNEQVDMNNKNTNLDITEEVKKELNQSSNHPEGCPEENSPDGEIKEQAELKKEGIQDNGDVKKRKKRRKNKKLPQVQPCMNAANGYINGDAMALNGSNSDNYVLSVLRIMTKEEWRKMRNKYLNLQKQNMSVAKGRIRQIHAIHREKHKETHPIAPAMQVSSYSQTSDIDKSCDITGNKNNLEYMAGVIVRFRLEEPIIDNGKQIKSRLRAAVMEPVKYVDAVNGCTDVHVRCSSQKQAETISAVKGLVGKCSGEILTGVEESTYWDKIQSDRIDKITGKVKITSSAKKERGKDRVVKKYEEAVRNKHKYFDEGSTADD